MTLGGLGWILTIAEVWLAFCLAIGAIGITAFAVSKVIDFYLVWYKKHNRGEQTK